MSRISLIEKLASTLLKVARCSVVKCAACFFSNSWHVATSGSEKWMVALIKGSKLGWVVSVFFSSTILTSFFVLLVIKPCKAAINFSCKALSGIESNLSIPETSMMALSSYNKSVTKYRSRCFHKTFNRSLCSLTQFINRNFYEWSLHLMCHNFPRESLATSFRSFK